MKSLTGSCVAFERRDRFGISGQLLCHLLREGRPGEAGGRGGEKEKDSCKGKNLHAGEDSVDLKKIIRRLDRSEDEKRGGT